jgi:hypothetical protein
MVEPTSTAVPAGGLVPTTAPSGTSAYPGVSAGATADVIEVNPACCSAVVAAPELSPCTWGTATTFGAELCPVGLGLPVADADGEGGCVADAVGVAEVAGEGDWP